MNICVIGAGAWGMAIAIHLDLCGHFVTLVPRNLEYALNLNSTRESAKYLKGIKLPESIQINSQLHSVLIETECLYIACPSYGLRILCNSLKKYFNNYSRLNFIITLCKGIEPSTQMTPLQILNSFLPDISCGVISGPSFALDVAYGKPTSLVFGEKKGNINNQCIPQGNKINVYHTNDWLGVELGGCLKNIYAIGAGVCDGLQLGENAKATYLTKALNEMVDLGVKLGGNQCTFYGLSGAGDLFLTCMGQKSRNRIFGEQISQGNSLKKLMKIYNTLEGYHTVLSVYKKCKKLKLNTPILNEIYFLLYTKKSPIIVFDKILTKIS